MQCEVEVEYGHCLLCIVYCVTCADIYVCLKYFIYIFKIMILSGTTTLEFFKKRVKMQYEVDVEYGRRLLCIVYCVTCTDVYVCLNISFYSSFHHYFHFLL